MSPADCPKDFKFKNFVELWEMKAIRSLAQVREFILDGKLTIEVYQGVAKPLTDESGHGLVQFLAQHVQPYTVGWSNVIDFMRMDEGSKFCISSSIIDANLLNVLYLEVFYH